MPSSSLRGEWMLEIAGLECDQGFAIAADIESYPRFLPFCRSARVRRRDGPIWTVDNAFGAGPVQARFQTRAELFPPHRLEITSHQPPFHLFRLTWSFAPLTNGSGCRVRVTYRIDLRSGLLHALAKASIPEVERRVLASFRDRVRVLYGL